MAFYFSDGDGGEERITYAELQRASRGIAAEMLRRGLTGQRAILMFPPGLEFVKAFYGCMCAGVVAVPAFTPRRNRNVQRLQAISDDAQASLALTVADVMDRTQGMLDETPSLRDLDWLAVDEISTDRADSYVAPKLSQDQLAILQYTSGSTGTPKGVMLSHGNIMYNVTVIVYSFEPTQAGLGLTWLPTYHDMGLVGGVLQPLYIRPAQRVDVPHGVSAEARSLAAGDHQVRGDDQRRTEFRLRPVCSEDYRRGNGGPGSQQLAGRV